MENYLFNINQDSNSVININKLQEYKQGVRGNFKVQSDPNKPLDVEFSKIYLGYHDYYIGQVTPQGEILYILSTSAPNDIMQVKVVDSNQDFEFSLIPDAKQNEKKKYKIINRTRFMPDGGIISLGFDFEHCKMKKWGEVLTYNDPSSDTEDYQIPLLDFMEKNVICDSDTFSIIPDTSNKMKNITCIKSNAIFASSCQNILVNENCNHIVFRKQCGVGGQITIGPNCKNIDIGDSCGQNGNIVIEKNCENISMQIECGKDGIIIVQQNSGQNGGKIQFGSQCGNQGMIMVGKDCANTPNSILSFGMGQNQKSFIGLSFAVKNGVQNGCYVNNE